MRTENIYYILDDDRRHPIAVSRRHWRRWMKRHSDDFGYATGYGPVIVAYDFLGFAPLGQSPPLVWRVCLTIPTHCTPDPNLHIEFKSRWQPDPVGISFELARYYPLPGPALMGYHQMCDRAKRLLTKYHRLGGSFPPHDDDDHDHDPADAWKHTR